MPKRRELLDFELQVTPTSVALLRSPVGEDRVPFQPSFDAADLPRLRHTLEQHAARSRDLLLDRSPSRPTLQAIETFGERLFESIFHGTMRRAYDSSRAVIAQQRQNQPQGLRVKLRIDESLAIYPWELLRDPDDDFLALTPGIALVRYQELPIAAAPLVVQGPLRILIVAGHAPDLDLPQEVAAIQTELESLARAGSVEVAVLEQASLAAVYERLRSGSFHVLHYLGHGAAPRRDQEGGLLFAGGPGGELVRTQQLWRMLRRVESLRLIWLNSCSGAVGTVDDPLTSTAIALVRAGVPAVIANQLRISDHAAIALAREFYTALAQHVPVDESLAEARAVIGFQSLYTLEWATPILFMRSPDGVLFDQPDESSQTADAATESRSRASAIDFGQGNNQQGATINISGDVAGGDIIKSRHDS
jgi:hypothetical protein